MAVVNLSCGKDMGKIRWNQTEFLPCSTACPAKKREAFASGLQKHGWTEACGRMGAWLSSRQGERGDRLTGPSTKLA